MLGIDAVTDIASVKNVETIGDRAVHKFVRDTMNSTFLSLVPKETIPIIGLVAGPEPTGVSSLHLLPELPHKG